MADRPLEPRAASEQRAREPRAGEGLWRLVVEHTPAAVAVLDRDLRYLACSRRWLEDYRLERRDLVGRSHYDVFPEVPERWKALHRRALAGEILRSEEDSFVRGDGSVERLRWEIRPWHTEVGEVGGIVLFSEVLTERKRTEKALERTEALSNTVLNTVPDAILSIDEHGVIQRVNPATTRLFGYEESELLGRNVRMLMPSPYAEEHDGYLERYRRTGEARIIGKGREVEARRKDGSVFPVRLAVGEAHFDGSRLFTGIIHDLSEVRDLEQQLIQSQKLEAIGALAGGVAHDFNNLLTSIRGSSEILIDHLDPTGRLARSARRIQRAADRATAITTRLLAFSRQQVTQHRVIDLNDVVRETAEILAHTLPEDLDKKLDLAGEPLYVGADATQLGQVLMNLVVNAADAMSGGGSLTVATGRRAEGGVALVVRDTGEGIPAERLGRIFDPFFTTKEPGKGTGLGLSTTRAIVREHGGEIEVRSEVGRGTIFTVLLPEVEAPSREVAEGDEIVRVESAGETILLVEDDDIARELLVEVLEEGGYAVVATGSPEEALRRAREPDGAIDLLVTDVVLPGMTGLRLAAEIRAQHPAASVLYMSGYTDQKLADRGELGGDETFLRKPFGNHVLLQKVREVLDGDRSS